MRAALAIALLAAMVGTSAHAQAQANAADAAETITVKNAAGSSLGTIEQNRIGHLVVLAGAWLFNYKQIVTLS